MESANCWIYKSTLREGMYLYVTAEEFFDAVPTELLARFGERKFVMSLELTAARRLARADAPEVLRQLAQQGFYLQMPPSDVELRSIDGSRP